MVQETEKYRDEDEANESKYKAENGLEKSRVTVCNTLTVGKLSEKFESGDGHG